jgi:hypothetical protein
MENLCRRPPLHVTPASPAANVPLVITTTEHQVEAVRGLQYEHPVSVDAITHGELVGGIDKQFEHSFPDGLMHRRGLAWQTIGVLSKGTDLQQAYHNFFSSQVIGFYDPASKQLVFIGADSPTPQERLVLAHELTHALDDQHFGLVRINGLENRCADEQLQAASGVIEGSAVYFSAQVVYRFFTQRDQIAAFSPSGSVPHGIPQFLLNMQQWPYIAGPRFIAALVQRGGTAAVNDALEHPPVSTEQVIHPERYPGDVPTPLDIPDLGPKLGKGWSDLDVEEVGEEWLSAWLGLRLDPTEWRPATDGWDGGLYRAWSDGEHVAVVMTTAWDTAGDAGEFEHAVSDAFQQGQPASLFLQPNRVTVLFASDQETLTLLKKADGIRGEAA